MDCKVGVTVVVGAPLEVGELARGGVSPWQATTTVISKAAIISPGLRLLKIFTADLTPYIDGLRSDEVP